MIRSKRWLRGCFGAVAALCRGGLAVAGGAIIGGAALVALLLVVGGAVPALGAPSTAHHAQHAQQAVLNSPIDISSGTCHHETFTASLVNASTTSWLEVVWDTNGCGWWLWPRTHCENARLGVDQGWKEGGHVQAVGTVSGTRPKCTDPAVPATNLARWHHACNCGTTYQVTLSPGIKQARAHTTAAAAATLAHGCQHVLWTAGDASRRGVVCFALKRPPAGMEWNLVLDGTTSFTVHRGTVIEGFLFTPGHRQVHTTAATAQRRCTRDIGVRRYVGQAVASWTHKCVAYVQVMAEWNDGVIRYGAPSAGLADVVKEPTSLPLAKPNCAGWRGLNAQKQVTITKFPVVGTC
jgi:hypothetical protein